MIWVSYQIGCQRDEPCGFSGDHWQMQQCFNVFTDIYKVLFPGIVPLLYSLLLLLLPSHVNLTGYGGGSAMAVITQMVVFQLVIWMVMLSWCFMLEWRGMNFVRVLQRSRRWTRHDNDRKIALNLWYHQVQSSQDDPVRWWTEPKASSLSTEPGDICSSVSSSQLRS